MAVSYPWLALESRRDPEKQWITWAVRMKLDLSGIRIGLGHWQALTESDRDRLHDFRVENRSDAESFKKLLLACMPKSFAEIEAAIDRESAQRYWDSLSGRNLPDSVQALIEQWNLDLDWKRLNLFGRYVFCAIAEKRNPEDYKEDAKALLSSPEFSLLAA
jgi:hypothetical protein